MIRMINDINVTKDGDLYRATAAGFPNLVEWAKTKEKAIALIEDSVVTYATNTYIYDAFNKIFIARDVDRKLLGWNADLGNLMKEVTLYEEITGSKATVDKVTLGPNWPPDDPICVDGWYIA